MRIFLTLVLALTLAGFAPAGESSTKWKARIKVGGKGPSVEVTTSAKDKPTARKLIIAQYGDKTVFTSGPTRVREGAR